MFNNIGLKKIVIFSFLFLLIVSVLSFVLNNSILIVSNNSDNNELIISSTKKGSLDEPKPLKIGINILPKGSYSVNVSSGISLSKKNIDVRPLKIEKFNAVLSKQKEVKKIARSTEDCFFGKKEDLSKGTIFSYACIQPMTYYKNIQTSKGSQKTAVKENTNNHKDLTSYQGSLLSLAFDEGEVDMISYDGTKESIYELSKENGFKNTITESYKLSIDNESIYILDYQNNTLYHSKKLGDKFISFSFSTENELDSNTNFRVNNNKLYIISPQNSSDDHGDTFDHGFFYSFDLEGSGSHTKKLGKEIDNLLDFEFVNNTTIASLSISGLLTLYEIKDDSIKEYSRIYNANGYTILNNKLYFINEGDVYSYDMDSKIQSLEFGSSKINIRNIKKVDDTLVISGFSNSETTPTNQVYLLTDQEIKSKYRIEDVIPYGNIDTQVDYMDYFEKNLYIVPKINSLRRDLSTVSDYTYNTEEYSTKVNEINKQLENDGLTSQGFRANYFPY